MAKNAAQESLHWWPTADPQAVPQGVIIATVNYNTKRLVAHLLWSIYRFLGQEVRAVVVIDNGSTDGSRDLLAAVAAAGLCKLVVNQQNHHHGPALTQALSLIAQAEWTRHGPRPWVWLLDSDCVIARANAALAAIDAATQANAKLVGEAYWNQWHSGDRFAGYSVLLDPAHVWQPAVGVIPDDGDPIGEFEQACRTQGVTTASFPFARDGYLIHVGRSTLATIHQRGEVANPLYSWAQEHNAPHFQEVARAAERYRELLREFNCQLPELTPAALVRSLQQS